MESKIKELDLSKKGGTQSTIMAGVSLGFMMGICAINWDFFMRYSYLAFLALVPMIVSHELTHGLFFRLWAGKVKFGYLNSSIGPLILFLLSRK